MMSVTAIVPAAGGSTRFGSDKLARDLGGRPLLVRTVEALSRRAEVRQIIVAGPPGSFEAFAARFGPVLGFHGAELVEGLKSALASGEQEQVKAALKRVGDTMHSLWGFDQPTDAIYDEAGDKYRVGLSSGTGGTRSRWS